VYSIVLIAGVSSSLARSLARSLGCIDWRAIPQGKDEPQADPGHRNVIRRCVFTRVLKKMPFILKGQQRETALAGGNAKTQTFTKTGSGYDYAKTGLPCDSPCDSVSVGLACVGGAGVILVSG
jgi:hypothetical protein